METRSSFGNVDRHWMSNGSSLDQVPNRSRRQWLACGLAAGVSAAFATFERLAGAEVEWLENAQLPPRTTGSEPIQLRDLLASDNPSAARREWTRRRAEFERWWSDYLGVIRPSKGPIATQQLSGEERDGVVRQRILYEVDPGWPVEAYLLRPARLTTPAPGVVVLHSTVDRSIDEPAGIGGRDETAFGWQLAQLGYVALCPRNFLWPSNDRIDATAQATRFLAQRPGSKGMAKMLMDAMTAVDLLAADPLVDANRLGAVGHSLGAKEVLYLAAFDPRIRVAVSSEGGIGTQFSNWDAPWYLGSTIGEASAQHEHHELLALVAPRAFLLIGGESADGDRSWPFIEQALRVYRLHDVPPRLAFVNHRQGHTVPPMAVQRIHEWLKAYL